MVASSLLAISRFFFFFFWVWLLDKAAKITWYHTPPDSIFLSGSKLSASPVTEKAAFRSQFLVPVKAFRLAKDSYSYVFSPRMDLDLSRIGGYNAAGVMAGTQ